MICSPFLNPAGGPNCFMIPYFYGWKYDSYKTQFDQFANSPKKYYQKVYVEEGNIFPTYLEGRDAPSPPIVSRKVA